MFPPKCNHIKILENRLSKIRRNILLENESSKKLRLCGGWGLATTFCALTDAAIYSNRLNQVQIQVSNGYRIVKTAIYVKIAEILKIKIQITCIHKLFNSDVGYPLNGLIKYILHSAKVSLNSQISGIVSQ